MATSRNTRGSFYQQFEPPDRPELAILRPFHIKRLNATLQDSLDDVVSTTMGSNIHDSPEDITTRNIRDPVRADQQVERAPDGSRPISREVILRHSEMICEYVNRSNGRGAPGDIPVCTMVKDLEFLFDISYGISTPSHAANILNNHIAYDSVHFQQIKYIFIPSEVMPDNGAVGHIILIAISPMAKTVEVLDALIRIERSIDCTKLLLLTFKILHKYMGRDFIPREWRVRTGQSEFQGNTQHCGVFTLSNTMCLAFGYSLKYMKNDPIRQVKIQRREQQIQNKRKRIASELYNGRFESRVGNRTRQPYYYPLHNITPSQKLEDKFEDLIGIERVHSRLPVAARRRTGIYDRHLTKVGLITECNAINAAGPVQRMRGFNPNASKLVLRNWMESRDYKIDVSGTYIPF